MKTIDYLFVAILFLFMAGGLVIMKKVQTFDVLETVQDVRKWKKSH